MKNASKSESKDRDRYHSDILTNMNNLRQFAQDQIEINKEINYLNSSSKKSSYQNHQYQVNKNYDEISNSPPRKKAHNLFFNNRIDPLAQIDTRFPTTQNSQLKNKYSESPKTKSKKFKTKKDQTVSEITSIISPINYKIKNKKKKRLEYNPYLNSKYVQVNPRDIDNFDDIYRYDAKDQIQEQNFNDFKMFQLKSLYFDIWSNKWKRNNIKKIKMDLDYFTKLNNTLKQKETIIPEEEVARELYRLRKRKEKIKQNGFLNYNSSNFSDSNDSFEETNLIKFVQSQSSLESENSIDNELQTPPIYDSQNESDGPPLFFRNRLSYYQLKVGKNKKEEKPDPPLFFEDSSENERFFAAINCNANLIEQENNQIGNNTIDKTEKEEDKQQLGHLNESKLSSNSDQKFDSNKIQKESIPNEKSREKRENQENNQKDESIDIEEEEEANDNFLSPKSNNEINKTIEEEEEELNDYFLSPKNSEKEEEEQISDTHSTKSNEKADKQDEKVDSSSTKSCTKTDKSTKEEEEATNSSSINGSEKDNNLAKEEKVKSNSIKGSKNSSQINQEEENTNSNSIKDNKMTKEEEEINSNSIKSSKNSSQINQEEEENANSNSIKDTKLAKKDDDKKSDFIKNSKNTNQISKEEEEEENFSSLANSIKSNKSNEESEKKKENSKKSNEESEKSNLLNESDQNDPKGQLKDISSKSASKSDLLIKLPSSGEDFFLNDYENNPHHSSSNSDINTKTHKSQQDDQNEYNLSQMINSEEIADESQPFDEITTSELFENESENPNKKEIKDDQILNNDKKSFVVEEEEDESDAFLSSQKEIVDQLKNNQNIVLIDDEGEGIGTQSYDDDFFSFEKEPKQNKDNQYDYSQSEKKKQSRHKIDSSASEKKNQLQTNSSSHSKNQKNHKNISSETEKQIQHQTNSSSHSKNHKNLSSESEKQIQRQTNSSSHSRNNKNVSSGLEKQIQYQTDSSSHSKSQKNSENFPSGSERRYHHKFNSFEEDEEIESQSKKEIFSFEEEEEELDDDNLNDSDKLFSSGHLIIHDSNKPIFTSPFDEKRFKENEEKEEVEPLSKEQSRIIFGRLVDYYDSDDDKDYELNNDKKESNWYKRFDSSSLTDKSFEIFEIPSRRRNVKNSSSSDDAIVIHIHDPEYDD